MRISIKQISRKANCPPNMVMYVARAMGIKFGRDSMIEEDVAIKLAEALEKRRDPKMVETLKPPLPTPVYMAQ